jgi:hypothetical protein
MADTETELYNKRWAALVKERSSWMNQWRDISRVLLPRSGRFLSTERNRGERKHNNIYDNTGTRALRTLAAGMMSGMTSPARPWFRLTTSDPKLDESPDVKQWLSDVTRLLQMVFAKSNTYRALQHKYTELGGFGTSGTIIVPDFKSIIHCQNLTIGEYAIATNPQDNVDTLYREFDYTVGNLVREFGIDNCSQAVKRMYSQNLLDEWVPLIHAIEPRLDRDVKMKDNKNMEYKSCYFEKNGEKGKILRESGFDKFNALVARWDVQGGDIYGNCPGQEALGDLNGLQHSSLHKAQVIDFKVMPPIQVPSTLKGKLIDTLPGGIIFADAATQGGGGIRNAFEINITLQEILADIGDTRNRVNAAFYADLFLMLQGMEGTQMTATEVAERHEEKLLMLGPVVERLHNEILDPLIDITFTHLLKAGLVPPAPKELHGRDLNVEFVSILAQAQRAIATNSIDKYVMAIGSIAQFKPEVLDKFNSDTWADVYGDILGVDPSLIVPTDQVVLIRNNRAKAQQAQAQTEQLQQSAGAVKDLANAKVDDGSALSSVMNNLQGYS